MKILDFVTDLIYGKKFKAKARKRDYFLLPFYAVLIAVVFRSFLFDNFHIPSGSMKSTLLIGDKITVSKFAYGYGRYSLPFGIVPFSGRVMEFNRPQRGDIMVFKYPGDTSINYVKRLIGLPGDRVKIIGGELYLNGARVEREFLDNYFDDEIMAEIPRFKETLPNGKSYEILKFYSNGRGYVDNTREFLVPEGHYFFLGDNRDFSQDSRFENVGFVSEDLVLGRAERILISSPNSLLNVFAWHKIRFGRTFSKP